MQYNKPAKTVGSQTARLLASLYDRSQTTFTLADVERITGLHGVSARTLIHKAAKRGLVSRLKPGLFVVVPPELGSSTEYMGNPYMVAQRLAAEAPGFISHGSAMEIHRMVTQPQLVVFFSSTKRIPSRTIGGTEFHFVLINAKHLFGMTKHWATKQEAVDVSDLERTILDGLRQPEYCGGITEVAKGLWMRRQDVQVPKLVDYALRFRIGAVIRRLGYLLESQALGSAHDLERLQKALTLTYVPLDPLLPREGPYLAHWRIQVNIPPEELKNVRET